MFTSYRVPSTMGGYRDKMDNGKEKRTAGMPCRLGLLWLWAILGTAATHADGTFVWRGYERLAEPAQKAIIVHDEGIEDLFLQVKYEGPASDFGWIVPVPSKPTVREVTFSCFHMLEHRPGKRLDPGLLARIERLFTSHTWGGGGTVSIAEERDIGDYRVTVLRGETGKALHAWFDQHGFRIPKGGEAVLDRYIDKGWWFVAAKIRSGAQTEAKEALLHQGELAPLHLSFESDAPIYPLYISSLNKGVGEIVLHVFSRELVACPSLMPEREDFISTRELSTNLANVQQTEPVSFFQTDRLLSSLRVEINRPLPGPWYCSRFQKAVQYEDLEDDWVFEANPALVEELVRTSRRFQKELYSMEAIRSVEQKLPAEERGSFRFTILSHAWQTSEKKLLRDPKFEVPPRMPSGVTLKDLLGLVRAAAKSPPSKQFDPYFGEWETFALRRDVQPLTSAQVDQWLEKGRLTAEFRRYLIRYGVVEECLRFCHSRDNRRAILKAFDRHRDMISPPRAEDASEPKYPWHREELHKWLKTPDMRIFEEGYYQTYMRLEYGFPYEQLYVPASLPFFKRRATWARFIAGDTGRWDTPPNCPQTAALRLLTRHRDPLAFELLADWLDHSHVNVRRSALNIMLCSLGNSLAGCSTQHGELLPYVHASALDHRERNMRLLRPLLNDPDHHCRLAAARALGWFGDRESAPIFQEHITNMLRMGKTLGDPADLPDRRDDWTPEQAAFLRQAGLAAAALLAAANDPSADYARLIAKVLDAPTYARHCSFTR